MSDTEVKDIVADILSDWGPSRPHAIRAEAARRGCHFSNGQSLRLILEQDPERFVITSDGWRLNIERGSDPAVDAGLHEANLTISSIAYRILKRVGRPLELNELTSQVLRYKDALPSSVHSMIALDPRLTCNGSSVRLQEWEKDDGSIEVSAPSGDHEVRDPSRTGFIARSGDEADHITPPTDDQPDEDFHSEEGPRSQTPSNIESQTLPDSGKIRDLVVELLLGWGRPAYTLTIVLALRKRGFYIISSVELEELLGQDPARFSRTRDGWGLSSETYNAKNDNQMVLQALGASGVVRSDEVSNVTRAAICTQCGYGSRLLAQHCGKCGASLSSTLDLQAGPAQVADEISIHREAAVTPGLVDDDASSSDIAVLGLSARSHNALMRGGVLTVKQLKYLYLAYPEELWRIRNLGTRSIAEIVEALERYDELAVQGLDLHHEQVIVPAQQTIHDTLGLRGYLTYQIDISDLELDLRTSNALRRNKVTTVNALCEYSSEEVKKIRNVGIKMLGEIELKLTEFWSTLPPAGLTDSPDTAHQHTSFHSESTRVVRPEVALPSTISMTTLAQQIGITKVPRSWGWADLLDLGYDWKMVEILDATLKAAGLPPLHPLPHNSMISVEAVHYLLYIGCPLHNISASRITLNKALHQLLHRMKLSSLLSVCLTESRHLSLDPVSYEEFQRDLSYYLEWLGTQSDWQHEVNESQPSPVALLHLTNIQLGDLVKSLLANERRSDMLIMRYGLDVNEEFTLQEVAARSGVTRERVRQICTHALPRLQAQMKRNELLQALLWFCKEVIAGANVITMNSLLRELTEQLNISIGKSGRFVKFLLELDGNVSYIKSLDTWVSPGIGAQTVEGVTSSVKNQLQRAKAPMTIDSLAQGLQDAAICEEIVCSNHAFIEKCLEADSDFDRVDNSYWGLRSWKRRIIDDMVIVLRVLDRPAHFAEIAELVNERLAPDQQRSDRVVYTQLEHHGDLFVRTGRGTYALREWDPTVPSQPVKYIDLMEQILREEGMPLPMEVIFQRVHARREAKLSSISMYLQMNSRFAQFGGAFGLAEWKTDGRFGKATDPEKGRTLDLPNDFLEQLKTKALEALNRNQED